MEETSTVYSLTRDLSFKLSQTDLLAWTYKLLERFDYIFMGAQTKKKKVLSMLSHLEQVEMTLTTPLFKKVFYHNLIRPREFSTLQVRAEDN